MPTGPYRSRFADLNRAQALAVGLLLCAATGMLLFTAFAYDTRPPKLAVPEDDPASGDDFLLFRRLAEHVRAGENYHEAAFREMRAHRFPTGSPFNFRTPTYAWVLGILPSDAWGRGLLMLIALAALVANFRVDSRDLGVAGAVVGGFFLIGVAMWTWDSVSIYSQELWASMLIALSLGLLGLGRRYPAIAIGILALFFRELALPYCLLACGVAFWHKRRLEGALWLFGVAIYFLFLGWHAHEVLLRMTSEDQARSDWLCFGGLKAPARMSRTPRSIRNSAVFAIIDSFSTEQGPAMSVKVPGPMVVCASVTVVSAGCISRPTSLNGLVTRINSMTPGRSSNARGSTALRFPVMPMAVRVDPGSGCGVRFI